MTAVRASVALMVAGAVLLGCQASPQPSLGVPAVTVQLAAANLAFDQTQLVVQAAEPFAIVFDNREGIPHNVSIDTGAGRVSGPVVTGPAVTTYLFAGLPEGQYKFFCELHPNMSGVLEVVAGLAR